MDDADRFAFHEADTMKAGADLCDRETVRLMVREAPDVIRELSTWGVDFDKEDKVTSLALDEFLDGEIDWDKTEESIEQ